LSSGALYPPSYVAVRTILATGRPDASGAAAPGTSSSTAPGIGGTGPAASSSAWADTAAPAAAFTAAATPYSGGPGLAAGKHERPLVVSGLTQVDTNRGLGTAAANTHQAAADVPLRLEAARRRQAPAARLTGRISASTGTRPAPGSGLAALAGLLSEVNRHEVLAGDRILPLLPDHARLDQRIEAGRPRSGSVAARPLIQSAHPLLTAEDELGFLLALRLMTPNRHGHAHQHCHHGHCHQHRCHRVTALVALTL
jgi:hypothetical protein